MRVLKTDLSSTPTYRYLNASQLIFIASDLWRRFSLHRELAIHRVDAAISAPSLTR